ncbi:MAG: fibronectin type III domain-containing protein [Christensenellaceae bacterium]|jgi:hypothetical protein|nr:fibronectin type III domain-containing protein [Christensenellaceae bacterium]
MGKQTNMKKSAKNKTTFWHSFWQSIGAGLWGKRSVLERTFLIVIAVFVISNSVFIGLYFNLIKPHAFKTPVWENLPPYVAPPEPLDKNADPYFANFVLANFSAESEPMIKQTFGNTLSFDENSYWEYPSYNSFSVAFATNLPTLTVVEYGATVNLGKSTEQTSGYFYNHLHHLRGLKENETYYYRFIAQTAEPDVQQITSPIYHFTTRDMTADGVIKIPNDFGGIIYSETVDGITTEYSGPPYYLTTANAKYVLTRDLIVPNCGLIIKNNNITIDLNGFTIKYDNAPPEKNPTEWGAYFERGSYGVRIGLWNFYGQRLFNGTILQGEENTASASPVNFYHDGATPATGTDALVEDGNAAQIAGLTVIYTGPNTGVNSGHTNVHHNIIHDKGTVVDDRHSGVVAINGDGASRAVYNSLRRFRQTGIRGPFRDNSNNELYSDSFVTNSFAIAPGDGQTVHNNKIFGMGYLPIGIGWADDIDVRDNFIYIHSTAPTQRSGEYDRNSSAAGIRYTSYGVGMDSVRAEFRNNVIIVKAHEDSQGAAGLWLSNNPTSPGWIFEDNIIRVERLTDKRTSGVYDNYSCIQLGGVQYNWGDAIDDPLNPIIFRRNTLIGNEILISFGTSYGGGGTAWFYDTKMVKLDNYSENFNAIRSGWWYYSSMNHRFVNTTTVNFTETELQNIVFFGRSTNEGEEDGGRHSTSELRFGISKQLQFVDGNGTPLTNAIVTVSITSDYRTERLTTDEDGYVTLDLLSIRYMKTFVGPPDDDPDTAPDHNGDVITITALTEYTFTVAGFPAVTIATADLQNGTAKITF